MSKKKKESTKKNKPSQAEIEFAMVLQKAINEMKKRPKSSSSK